VSVLSIYGFFLVIPNNDFHGIYIVLGVISNGEKDDFKCMEECPEVLCEYSTI
jgi:hypothetical protein